MPRATVVAFAAAGFLALGSLAACKKDPAPPSGNVAARLTVPTLAGAPFDPSSLAGKPAVVVFWRPGCPHCRDELPEVARLARDKGVTAVAVQVAEAPSAGERVLAGIPWEGVALVDAERTLSKEFEIKAVPWTLVLRPDGTAAKAYVGAQSYETLAKAVASVSK